MVDWDLGKQDGFLFSLLHNINRPRDDFKPGRERSRHRSRQHQGGDRVRFGWVEEEMPRAERTMVDDCIMCRIKRKSY